MPTPTLDPETGKFRPSDAGCWYDSHRGFRGIAIEIIEDARILGCDKLELPEGAELDDMEDQELETLHWDAEVAEQWLDDLAPEGYSVGWYEGDFGMYKIVDGEVCHEDGEDDE